MKQNYSEPKIYTGGVDIEQWSKLTSKEKKEALSKEWYVYYSFRNPQTNRLVRQSNIKGGANSFKNKRQRYTILRQLKEPLIFILERGYNPYHDTDNQKLKDNYLNFLSGIKADTPIFKTEIAPAPKVVKSDYIEIRSAISSSLNIKKHVQKPSSFTRFKSRINQFERWLYDNGFKSKDDILTIEKSTVIKYLNGVLQKTSPTNRNNTRTDLATLFQTMADNEMIPNNFVAQIHKETQKPTRNKTYSSKMLKKILKLLEEKDPTLLLFVYFVGYGLLRPIEICRLRIKDIDHKTKTVTFRSKTKTRKTKIIPDILYKELPDLSKFTPDAFLFTSEGMGVESNTTLENRRDYFSKRFRKLVKLELKLDVDQTMYSFRHTFITKLYRELSKLYAPFETKSRMMLITGHTDMAGLENYLREIDVELPEDYSDLLNIK